MKTSFLYLLLIISMISCSNPNGLLMKTSNTIQIEETDSEADIITKAAHVVPTPNQYSALKNEFIAFIHFGPNAFTRMEWGSGMEDPAIFNLQNLDTDQWCKAMKAAGMKMVIITVKHHDGFCLWQSRYTQHGVMSSPFKDGQGDILKELSESCQEYGLKLGIYLSPADLYQIENPEGLYGNLSEYTERVIPRPVEGRPFENETTFTFKVDDYNEYFLNQLFELLTEYGPVHEVWFDGAHPKRKGGQTYNYLAWKELIHTLAPEAVVFGKQDIRWCGNESGRTRDTEWNIIPYPEDPNKMNSFPDITAESIGNREDLYKGKYLHYQPAETNTSIREGWFYRDDIHQKVRSADDVFDMYERSVGGNSIFLLNIPPNRNGMFSVQDVEVLEEVGKRIQETYSNNLFNKARGHKKVLDDDNKSFILLGKEENSFVINTPQPITCNRLIISEAITSHSERIEEHAVDAWIENDWQEIARASNVGYKRILRFPEVTSSKFRISVLNFRQQAAISNVSAHYYKTRPPQLDINREFFGMVSIVPSTYSFGWKPHREDVSGNLNSNFEIRYTTNGNEPDKTSKLYNEPFQLDFGIVKTVAYENDKMGSTSSSIFGILKENWQEMSMESEKEGFQAAKAFDGNPMTYWQSEEIKTNKPYISIDLGKTYQLSGFVYTPQVINSEGMIERGLIKTSLDGKRWETIENFEFGNLINDPSPRTHYFSVPLNTRYIQIEADHIAGGGKSATMAEIDFLPGKY